MGLATVAILCDNPIDSPVESGAYVLRMRVAAPLSLSFGRFQGGRPVTVPEGEVLYVGSAMGRRGSGTLARRLLRHATRTPPLPPHPIRDELLVRLQKADMGGPALAPPAGKRLRWHVDYLLDRPEATLTHVLAIRSRHPLEATLAQRLNEDPCTAIIAPGLGASDSPAPAHLLRLDAPPSWWEALVDEFG